MKKDSFNFDNESSKPENEGSDLNNLFNDEDFEIFKKATPTDDGKPVEETDSKGDLDDSLLSDDFIIGQDFFIDSAAADDIESESSKNGNSEKQVGEKKHKKNKNKI